MSIALVFISISPLITEGNNVRAAETLGYTEQELQAHIGIIREVQAAYDEIEAQFVMFPEQYRGLALELHIELGIPVSLMYALIFEESRWDHQAVNWANSNGTHDVGLAQLNSQYLEYFERHHFDGRSLDPYNGLHSLEIGMRYLRSLYDRFDHDWQLAVAAYNAGPGRVKRGYIPSSTRRYVARIFTRSL